MEELSTLLNIIQSSISNPYIAAAVLVVGVVLGIVFYVFKGKIRNNQAEKAKQKAKQKDINDLERKNSEADASVRDRLNNRQ